MSPNSSPADCRIIAIANQKGGVGKTTTAVNLAAALGNVGHAVTLIDLDPQGNASTGLAVPADQRLLTSYDLLMFDESVERAAIPTATPGVHIVPATSDLASVEIELAGQRDRLQRLMACLRRGRIGGHVIIDCPPALGLLTLNALAAADGVLIPLQAEFYALEGLSSLMVTIREVRKINPRLRIDGVILTMHDGRNRLAQQVEADARATLGEVVYDTIIPRNVRLSEAPSHGLSVLEYDGQSRGSAAYRALAAEYLARQEQMRSA